jgi:hypothetical protein
MAREGVEEILVALSASRRTLEQKREEILTAKETLERASMQAEALLSEARKAAAAVVQPAENALAIKERNLKIYEHDVHRLEELLFVALRIIEQRLDEE